MKEGSGHKTPNPTMEVRAAAIVRDDLIVVLNKSVTSSFFFSTVFFSAFTASNLGGFGLGHNN